MAGTQYIGSDAVLQAYERCAADAWAIFHGKTLRIAGTGREELEGWLASFMPSGTRAAYTLRLYRDVEVENIRSSTDYSACFDFVLYDHSYGQLHGIGAGSGYQEVIARLDRLEKGGGDDAIDLNAIVLGWLQKPNDLAVIAEIIKGFFSKSKPLTTMGSTTNPTPDAADTVDRLSSVLNRLEKADPDILVHLEKLADVAENKPGMFKFLIGSLNGL